MSRLRHISFLLFAALLLLNAGHCVFPLFATQETQTCCTKGKCVPKSDTKPDDCCGSALTAQAGQNFEQVSILFDIAPTSESAEIMEADLLLASAHAVWSTVPIDTHAHAPPDEAASFNVPLLI